MAAKKKRTAKQIAATKKMLAARRRMLKKKKPGKKRAKKNPSKKKRTAKKTTTKTRAQRYYIQSPLSKNYWDGVGITAKTRSKAASFTDKGQAVKTAGKLANRLNRAFKVVY